MRCHLKPGFYVPGTVNDVTVRVSEITAGDVAKYFVAATIPCELSVAHGLYVMLRRWVFALIWLSNKVTGILSVAYVAVNVWWCRSIYLMLCVLVVFESARKRGQEGVFYIILIGSCESEGRRKGRQ